MCSSRTSSQGVARDLLAAAIDRFEARGLQVVFHCHDEVTVETPIGALSDQDFRAILLEAPAWAEGLPLGGKVHSGAHYLAPPEREAEPLAEPDPDRQAIEAAIDDYLDDARHDPGEIDNPALVEREDDEDFVASLPDEIAPLFEMVDAAADRRQQGLLSIPRRDRALVRDLCRPFPLFRLRRARRPARLAGAGRRPDRGRGDRPDQGLARTEPSGRPRMATSSPTSSPSPCRSGTAAGPLGGLAERYLDETRHVDLSQLPDDIHQSLRFHPACVFGPGAQRPCLIALMRDPLTDAPVGIQRIALEERDGQVKKIERRMLGQAGVVKLWPAGETLVVGEGLETVLAAATRIPYRGEPLIPAWAALSTAGLRALPIIPGVKRLILLSDNDENQEGQMAAAAAAARWQAAGLDVVTLTPPTPDSDFNDLVLQEDARVAD